jgi:glycosyltransferase involved in cell wall biosynthesis
MMPAYNAEKFITEAIESALSQSYPLWELIIVDDGSTDETMQIIGKYANPQVKIFHQENGGEASARNTALKQINGEFLSFLDSDDIYLPDHLEKTVKYLQDRAHLGGVYADGYYCDQNKITIKTLQSRRRGPFEGRVFEEVVRSSDVFGPPVSVVLRSNVILRNHLMFDTNIIIGPDWDFFTQFADLAEFGYLNAKTCLYRIHQTNISHQINFRERALELAKCRMKAIRMKSFSSCSLETRAAVFYDLLVNLLRGLPEKQSMVLQWSEFRDLPGELQGKLLRLMAVKNLIYENDRACVDEWIRRSLEVNPSDKRSRFISELYTFSPAICRMLLRGKYIRQQDPLKIPPFADLFEA